jgi:hypothetical protein
MNAQKILLVILLGHCAVGALAQGTLVYDQQSSLGGTYEGTTNIQSAQLIGQSFTPSLDAVGFIQLYLIGVNPGNNANAVVYVNLLSGSITGQNIGQSAPVTVTIGTEAAVNFLFSSPVTVSPGTTYYLQPVVQSGESLISESFLYSYSGGSAIFNGVPDPGYQLYFREGIIVPEPSTWALFAVGGATLLFRCRRFR